jgi:hypothetical protein
MAMGSLRGLSIGYDTIKSTPRDDGGRNLSEVKVWEVSLVTLPMNERAQVASVKSLLPVISAITVKDLEDDEDLCDDLRAVDHYIKRLLPQQRDDAASLEQWRQIDEQLKRLL